MLKSKVEKALNEQINKEMYSAFLYMGMSAYTDSKGWPGFANWFMVQYQEEMEHAMKLYHYIQDQGSRVILEAIDKPPAEFGTPLEMFKQTLAHEQLVTRSINDLMDLSVQEKDHATQIFLQWFVTEQVEEENNDQTIIDQLKFVGPDGNGLFMLDRELGTRMYTPPAGTE